MSDPAQRPPPSSIHQTLTPVDTNSTQATNTTATTTRGRTSKEHDAHAHEHHHQLRKGSRSPSATRFKDRMSGLVDKVKAAVGGSDSHAASGDAEDRGRSTVSNSSAGGEFKMTTGRGGAGNMFRSKSPPGSRDAIRHHGGGVVHVEEERAQSAERARSKERPHPSGRGGAGNIRSPSRDPAKRAADEQAVHKLDDEEHNVELHHAEELKDHPEKYAVGRGGAGNIH